MLINLFNEFDIVLEYLKYQSGYFCFIYIISLKRIFFHLCSIVLSIYNVKVYLYYIVLHKH